MAISFDSLNLSLSLIDLPLSLFISSLFSFVSLSIQVHAYIFSSLCVLVVKSSNNVHIVSLITNNYFYLLNRKEIKNDTANTEGID